MPFYNRRHDASDERLARAIVKTDVAAHFNGPGNEHGRMDFRHDLAKVACPVLMMAGEEDPVTPISLSEMTARCIPRHLVRFERLENCGHNVAADDPGRVFGAIREFILADDGRRRTRSGEVCNRSNSGRSPGLCHVICECLVS